jgi:REP element-mobilizing transposase RayT
MAALFIEVLRAYMRSGKMTVHDFVIMPNHVHILMTVPGEMTIEKAMQLIKGGFSFRANKPTRSSVFAARYGSVGIRMCASLMTRVFNSIVNTSKTIQSKRVWQTGRTSIPLERHT